MRGAMLGVALVLLTGCSSSRIVNSWSNEKLEGKRFSKVVVFGVSGRPDVRRTFEDSLCAELAHSGATAIPSYTLLPDAKKYTEDEMKVAVEKAGADGVLICRLARVDRQTQVTPGYYDPGPPIYLGPHRYGYYGYYDWAWGPGYYEPPRVYTYDVVTLEIRMVDATTGQLAWAGATQTDAPDNVQKDSAELAKVIVGELAKHGLVGK